MTCCFTGHRHFPWGDDTESPHRKDLLAGLENAVDWALVEGVTHFICVCQLFSRTCHLLGLLFFQCPGLDVIVDSVLVAETDDLFRASVVKFLIAVIF